MFPPPGEGPTGRRLRGGGARPTARLKMGRGGLAAPRTWLPATPAPCPHLCPLEHPPRSRTGKRPFRASPCDPALGSARSEHPFRSRAGERPLRASPHGPHRETAAPRTGRGGGGPVWGARARVNEIIKWGARRSGEPRVGPAAGPLNGAHGAAAAAARAGRCGRSCCEAESEADGARRWAASPPARTHVRAGSSPKGISSNQRPAHCTHR